MNVKPYMKLTSIAHQVHQENCYFLITTFKFLFMLSLPYMTFCTYDFLKRKLFKLEKYHLSKLTLTKEQKGEKGLKDEAKF
jgi:hypothetical protein